MNRLEHCYYVLKKPWVVSTYLILLVLSYCYVDKPVAIYVHQLNLNHHVLVALHALTALGKWSIYIGLFAVLGVFFRLIKKNKLYEQRAFYLLFCVLSTNLLVSFLKMIAGRARPALFFQDHLFGFYWFKMNDLFWSFPSGHAVTVGALVAGLSFILPRYFCYYLVFALLVMATRIILACHYLSDVMTGFYLSFLMVGFLTQIIKNNMKYLIGKA